MERVLHLSYVFCSSASTSSPTDDPSIHHLARCLGGPLAPTTSPTTRPSRPHGYSRLMHRWEPVALLQPWQHCPPHTLTLREQQTRTSVQRGTLPPGAEPGRGAGAGPGRQKAGRIKPPD